MGAPGPTGCGGNRGRRRIGGFTRIARLETMRPVKVIVEYPDTTTGQWCRMFHRKRY